MDIPHAELKFLSIFASQIALAGENAPFALTQHPYQALTAEKTSSQSVLPTVAPQMSQSHDPGPTPVTRNATAKKPQSGIFSQLQEDRLPRPNGHTPTIRPFSRKTAYRASSRRKLSYRLLRVLIHLVPRVD